MDWALLEMKGKSSYLSPSYFLSLPPPPPFSTPRSHGFNFNYKVSPSILLVIIILAVIFFISGLLHLLVRFLLRPPNRDFDEMDNVTALQGQLQQLFHLHDAGVDQSFIDALPVFNYKAIIGVKDPFDCAVCLCEFEAEDKLRLLPICSHAFHMDCIDTWLLSHSTCPLCRASLLHDFTSSTNFSPIVLVLESGAQSESSREIVSDREMGLGPSGPTSSHLSGEDFRPSHADQAQKSGEIQDKEDENQKKIVGSGEKVVSIKLGKFKSIDNGGEGCSEINADARRCFSMGSFAYVMDEHSSLQVPIRTPIKKQFMKKPCLTPDHRPAMSECGCDSRREFKGFEAYKVLEIQSGENKSIGSTKSESFSVSKIWLRGKKDKENAGAIEPSRRAFSFRFPLHRNPVGADGSRPENDRISEIGMSRLENEVGFYEETQSCNTVDSQTNAPSLAKRTLQWFLGRPNKVNSSFSSHV